MRPHFRYRAIDHAYNTTHIGGSHYHHIIDGHHSIWGAFHAVQHVHVDDSGLTQMGHALNHLAHDAASVSGINPFFSMTPDHFEPTPSRSTAATASRPRASRATRSPTC